MNIAIIGSNGFIGSNLVKHFSQKAEHNLLLFGTNEYNLLNYTYPYYQITSLSNEKVKEIFSSVDLVYYSASASIPASSWDSPMFEIENNIIPFLKFLENISNIGVKKVAFISSAGTIYGPSEVKVKEDFDKHPFSPYGIVKLSMEYFLNYYRIKAGLNFDIYRVSNVFGEGQNTNKGLGLINTFLENILLHNALNVYGDGNNLRNYIYVNDVVRLIEHSAISDLNESGEWNVASNFTLTINDIIEVLKGIIKDEFVVTRQEPRKSDNPKIDLDNSKILKQFPGFTFTDFNLSILNTMKYISNQISQK
jgi:UDP-glucose 4-epimerase